MPRYLKGKPPGPGRPPGSRNKATVVLEEIGQEAVGDVIRMVGEKATGGDLRAAAILLARAWPTARGRRVSLDLPAVESAANLVQAQAAVVAAVAAGEISPEEAASLSILLEGQRRAIETLDHDKRIQALERKKAEGPNPFDAFK
jgi:hypothetical protein